MTDNETTDADEDKAAELLPGHLHPGEQPCWEDVVHAASVMPGSQTRALIALASRYGVHQHHRMPSSEIAEDVLAADIGIKAPSVRPLLETLADAGWVERAARLDGKRAVKVYRFPVLG